VAAGLPLFFDKYEVAAVWHGDDVEAVLPFELETARPGCQLEDQPAIVRIFDDRSEGTSTSVKSSWRKRPATRLQQTRARPAPKLEVL